MDGNSEFDTAGDQRLIAYTDKWSVGPDEPVHVFVSSPDRYTARMVRLGLTEGPHVGVLAHPTEADFGPFMGQQQPVLSGSGITATFPPYRLEKSLTCSVFLNCSLLGGRQGVVSTRARRRGSGWTLLIDDDRIVFELTSGNSTVSVATSEIPANQWLLAVASYDPSNDGPGLRVIRVEGQRFIPTTVTEVSQELPKIPKLSRCLVGVGALEPDHSSRTRASEHFNGKIEQPMVWDGEVDPRDLLDTGRTVPVARLLVGWNFANDMSATELDSVGELPVTGHVFNLPTRAVLGHRSPPRGETDYRHAPEYWSAIYFHDDDIGDAGWEADFSLKPPDGTPSGLYAVELESDDGQVDYLPIVVRPHTDSSRSTILVVLPTLTYLAYANRRFSDAAISTILEREGRNPSRDDLWLAEHPELGSSVYGQHRDGSPRQYSSRLRPIPNLRPESIYRLTSQPRHLSLDLRLLAWLEHFGYDYDIAADDDVNQQGAALLRRYESVLTGAHPEYVTWEIREAFRSYLNEGPGRLAYLGGNGFYWVTGLHPDGSYIEVRRGHSAARSWHAHPAETHLATTGELGGLWRHRGLPPNQLLGVGFSSEGFMGSSPGYRRTEHSYEESVSWIFDDIDDSIIGQPEPGFPGAAGDEIDRADWLLGTPQNAVVLASARASDLHESYLPTLEDMMNPGEVADRDRLVRCDMVYLQTASGGEVFSASSINFILSLWPPRPDSAITKVLRNVIDRFGGIETQK